MELDGTLARKIGVTDKTPNIDGLILDSVIDYLNYVIIPALMVYWFQLVPLGWEIILPAGMFTVVTLYICKYEYEDFRLLFQWISSCVEYSCFILLYSWN